MRCSGLQSGDNCGQARKDLSLVPLDKSAQCVASGRRNARDSESKGSSQLQDTERTEGQFGLKYERQPDTEE